MNFLKHGFFKIKAVASLKIYKSIFFVFYMGREVKFKQFFLVFVLVLTLHFVFAETDTLLDIANTPPELIREIPNQSWQSNTSLENAFDLDDYFEDPEGEEMSYSNSNLTNLNVTIDENNSVSFFPVMGFVGEELVQFYADDGTHESESNWVYLNVGVDNQPPEWSDAKKDRLKVYQNDYVTFNVTWTDNFELMNYTFYINQEGTWTEKKGNLNGSKDYSTPKIQISSPAGKIVQWKICASDTSLNTACTDVFEFDVLIKPENPPSSGDETGEEDEEEEEIEKERPVYDAIRDLFNTTEKSDFSFNVNSFMVNLKQGTGTTKILEITNTGTSVLEFELFLEEVEEFVELSEETFNLSAGRTKRITVDFRALLDSNPGEYFGLLVVKSFKENRLPIYITIDELNVDFGVNVEVLEESKVVKPGKEVIAKIDLKNLKDQVPVDAVLYYAVKDFNGEIHNFREENVTFDSSLSLEKSLEISETAPIGNYIFYVRVYNQKDSAIYSDDFQIGQKFQFAALIRASSVFILISLFSFILFFFVIRYRRQKERGRVLNLYVKLNEMKELIKKGKFDQAAKAYIGIKRIYGEKVSPELLENKEKLIDAIKELSKKIDFDVKQKIKSSDKKGNSDKEGSEDKEKEGEDKEGSEDKEKEGEKEKGTNKEVISGEVKEKKEEENKEEVKKEGVKEKPKEKIREKSKKEIKEKSDLEKPKENQGEKKDSENKKIVKKKTNDVRGEKKVASSSSNERGEIKSEPVVKNDSKGETVKKKENPLLKKKKKVSSFNHEKKKSLNKKVVPRAEKKIESKKNPEEIKKRVEEKDKANSEEIKKETDNKINESSTETKEEDKK